MHQLQRAIITLRSLAYSQSVLLSHILAPPIATCTDQLSSTNPLPLPNQTVETGYKFQGQGGIP
jgi:hypothetical protein